MQDRYPDHIIDLIVYLVRRMHIGMNLRDIKIEKFRNYNHSEISAAYSWLIHNYETSDRQKLKRAKDHRPAPRALHPSERSHIAPDAYGYMLELYYLGIIDAAGMERLIEYAMFRLDGRTELSDIKQWAGGLLFESEGEGFHNHHLLKGTENIN